MTKKRIFTTFQIVVGLCDAATGILLILAPIHGVRLMGIQTLPAEPIYISFIGAFVFSVGVSYLFFVRPPFSAPQVFNVRAAWFITGLQRLCVASFVGFAVVSHQLEAAWLTVTVFDGAIAIFQFAALRTKYFEPVV